MTDDERAAIRAEYPERQFPAFYLRGELNEAAFRGALIGAIIGVIAALFGLAWIRERRNDSL
jgi:hypothetical protein